MKLFDVLEQLSNACGVSGREDEICKLIMEMLKPNVDDIKQDRLGNVIGTKRGRRGPPSC